MNRGMQRVRTARGLHGEGGAVGEHVGVVRRVDELNEVAIAGAEGHVSAVEIQSAFSFTERRIPATEAVRSGAGFLLSSRSFGDAETTPQLQFDERSESPHFRHCACAVRSQTEHARTMPLLRVPRRQ